MHAGEVEKNLGDEKFILSICIINLGKITLYL